jgi:hypothetical protein
VEIAAALDRDFRGNRHSESHSLRTDVLSPYPLLPVLDKNTLLSAHNLRSFCLSVSFNREGLTFIMAVNENME